MTSEHWQRIEALYHSALKVSHDERTALLAQADADVRRTVEAMLTQDDAADGVLDRPAWEQITVSDTKPVYSSENGHPDLAPGAQLGAYRIETKLGAGGMGEVYRAKGSRLNRGVAIKV